MPIEDVQTKRQLQEFIENTQKPGLPTDIKHLKSITNDFKNKLAAQGTAVTSLPASPVDGQIVYYQADPTNGVVWTLRYNASSASAYKWEYVGGQPLIGEVGMDGVLESTASAVYVNLTTAGPTLTVPFAGDYDLRYGAGWGDSSADGQQALMTFAIGGSVAADVDAVVWRSVQAQSNMRDKRLNDLIASVQIQARYRSTSGTARWACRTFRLLPIRVS